MSAAYEWDEVKAASNLARHGVSFWDATEVFEDPDHTEADVSDPDKPPLTDTELARFRAVRVAKAARRRAGLSGAKFAEAYHIKVARLLDIEQGRRAPEQVLVSLLTLIHDDPERAARVLREEA